MPQMIGWDPSGFADVKRDDGSTFKLPWEMAHSVMFPWWNGDSQGGDSSGFDPGRSRPVEAAAQVAPTPAFTPGARAPMMAQAQGGSSGLGKVLGGTAGSIAGNALLPGVGGVLGGALGGFLGGLF